ncbi:hypothetical protein JHK82_038982 [Glycine max]|nr:hypothetical protein JHK82_038982 [Glycine max]
MKFYKKRREINVAKNNLPEIIQYNYICWYLMHIYAFRQVILGCKSLPASSCKHSKTKWGEMVYAMEIHISV